MKFNAQFSITHTDGDVINTELLGVTFDDIRMEFGALSESFGALNVTVEITSYLRQRPLVIQSPEMVGTEFCERCAAYDETHGPHCPLHPDHDPTPYCGYCGARTQSACDCGPIAADN